MEEKQSKNDSPAAAITDDAARQRWEWFHRAISHAKELNHEALNEGESIIDDGKAVRPFLSIVK